MSLNRATPILIISSTEGHISLAKAIWAGLKQRGFLKVEIYIENSAILPYRLYYRYAPWLHQLVSYFLSSKKALIPLRLLLHLYYRNLTNKLIKKYQPTIVISTNYAFNYSFELLQRKKQLTYYTFICDPRSYFFINLAQPNGINLIFDTQQKNLIDQDFPQTINSVTGWFVRPEFKPTANINEAKNKIGIDPNQFCVLIVAGSEGMQRIQKTVKVLAETKTAMTILVACGRNQLLFKAIEQLGIQLSNSPVEIKPLGFIFEIAPYFQAADVVVGKAGPNMIFEATACHKPFFATTSLAGQEAGNLELIKELKIGFVETDINKAVKLIVDLVNNPEKITRLQPSIKKLAEFNQKSVDRLVKILGD